MVLDENLNPLHDLSREGLVIYQELLRDKANQILLNYKHPILTKLKSILDFLHITIKPLDKKLQRTMDSIKESVD